MHSRDRIPELDGFRVLLILVVSWFHIWQQSWLTPSIGSMSLDPMVRAGYLPVDGTILLSAFLLYLPYARAKEAGSPLPGIRDFYRRRIARILPSYYFQILLMLFAVVLPFGLYPSLIDAALDLVSHFTLSFTFFERTYMRTQLGAAAWTVVIECQAYVLFPFLARWVMRRPVPAILSLFGGAALFRLLHIPAMSNYGMVVNQLPNFLDVYAIGILCAMAYVKLKKLQKNHALVMAAVSLMVLAACTVGLSHLFRAQAASSGTNGIQLGQMLRRPVLALLYGGVMLSLPFAFRPIRFLFGNRVMVFLSGISFNYYLIHQSLAVHLKRLNIPFSPYSNPQMVETDDWKMTYTILCFGLSLIFAILITYGVEKPCGRWLMRYFADRDAKKEA